MLCLLIEHYDLLNDILETLNYRNKSQVFRDDAEYAISTIGGLLKHYNSSTSKIPLLINVLVMCEGEISNFNDETLPNRFKTILIETVRSIQRELSKNIVNEYGNDNVNEKDIYTFNLLRNIVEDYYIGRTVH